MDRPAPILREPFCMILASPTAPIPRSNITRIIHLALLVLVVHQVLGSQFIRMPRAGETPGQLFVLHEYLGLATEAALAVFWVWVLIRNGETRIGRLVPWFSTTGRRDVASDLLAQVRQLVHLRSPHDDDGALASAVHGLGLLLMTAMTITGTVYFFADSVPIAGLVLQIHKLLANLAWAYLIGHPLVAVLHHLLGSDIFARMFWFRGRDVSAPPSPRR